MFLPLFFIFIFFVSLFTVYTQWAQAIVWFTPDFPCYCVIRLPQKLFQVFSMDRKLLYKFINLQRSTETWVSFVVWLGVHRYELRQSSNEEECQLKKKEKFFTMLNPCLGNFPVKLWVSLPMALSIGFTAWLGDVSVDCHHWKCHFEHASCVFF